MRSIYDPQNWYWIVGSNEAQVFSSATGDYLDPSAAAYIAWQQAGNNPSRIASEAELGDVLAGAGVRPMTAGVLDGYQESHARRLALGMESKILMWLVNEARSWKGQQPLSAAGFRAFVKELL